MASISSDFFFYVSDGNFMGVDTKYQRTFQIDKKNVMRIIDWLFSENQELNPEQDHELISARLLLESNPENGFWKGDQLSHFVFNATRNLNKKIPHLTKKDVIKQYLEFSEERVEKIQSSTIQDSDYFGGILFPKPDLSKLKDVNLHDAIFNRETCRNFDGKPIDINYLSLILYTCFGEIHGKDWAEFSKLGLNQPGIRKSSPSATGLQSCSAYIYVLNVSGLNNGIYLYDAGRHGLTKINDTTSNEELIHLTCDQFWADGISFGIFIVIDMEKIWAKDTQARAYPIAFAEAGHFSQTIQLIAAGLNIKTWITGTFRDEILNEKLSIEKNSSLVPCFFVGLGNGVGGAIPAEFKQLLETSHQTDLG